MRASTAIATPTPIPAPAPEDNDELESLFADAAAPVFDADGFLGVEPADAGVLELLLSDELEREDSGVSRARIGAFLGVK